MPKQKNEYMSSQEIINKFFEGVNRELAKHNEKWGITHHKMVNRDGTIDIIKAIDNNDIEKIYGCEENAKTK